MMKKLFAFIFLMFTITLLAQAAGDIKAYPPAEKGMVRHILHLPKKDNESLFRIELIVGKTMRLDKSNQYFFGGSIEPLTVAGWGYTYYKVKSLGPMAGTLMAADPAAPKTDRFITLGGKPYFIRYNSRTPIVVYIPEDAEVLYKIWSTEAEMKEIERG